MSKIYHVYPLNDKKGHLLEGNGCPCKPKTIIEGASLIVVHNAWDFRNVSEWLNKDVPKWDEKTRLEIYEDALNQILAYTSPDDTCFKIALAALLGNKWRG